MSNEKTVEEKKASSKINWKQIVGDAKVMKHVDVPWDESDFRVYYKELVGEEGLSIESKYPNDVAKVLYEKTYMMIAKANVDIDDESAKLTRQVWDQLPERLRNAVVQKIWQLEKLMQENFPSLPGQN